MLGSPFRFESRFTDSEYQKLGLLALRWSHTEHIIGSCLKVMLRLSDDEAVVVVFGISTTQRLQLIRKLAEVRPMTAEATTAFDEFASAWAKIQYVRNTVIHAIIDESGTEPRFHLRSGKRYIEKADVFSIEELTNYAAHAAHVFRFALGFKGAPGEGLSLPKRPSEPPFLASIHPAKKVRPVSTVTPTSPALPGKSSRSVAKPLQQATKPRSPPHSSGQKSLPLSAKPSKAPRKPQPPSKKTARPADR